MDDKKTIIRNIIIYIIGVIVIIHDYVIRGININTEHNLTYIAILYVILFTALVDFYELIKNGKKQVARKIEYFRLLFGFLFIAVFVYNILFI